MGCQVSLGWRGHHLPHPAFDPWDSHLRRPHRSARQARVYLSTSGKQTYLVTVPHRAT
jgi:hypothetical protein